MVMLCSSPLLGIFVHSLYALQLPSSTHTSYTFTRSQQNTQNKREKRERGRGKSQIKKNAFCLERCDFFWGMGVAENLAHDR
ncbi:hypothetical protein BC940DRAFT_33412 [Gongronella butleri]|nr:hypothetical protein BC940DRAFT_33412 [Gongronella butleri]